MAVAPKCKVLIVEDEGLLAADLKRQLETAGYAVPRTADTAGKALKAIAETTPDIVLMDLHLSGKGDATEVAERVRNEFDLPVVYLTAYDDRLSLDRAGKSEAAGYIQKPVAVSSLRGSLELAISKHRMKRYLRQQRDWLAACFAATPDAVVVTDGCDRISYLNSHAEKLTGFTAANALGQPCARVLRFLDDRGSWPLDGTLPIRDFVQLAMLEAAPIPLPSDICLSGLRAVVRVEGAVSPLWQQGRIAGVIFTFRDIAPQQIVQDIKLEENKEQALSQFGAALRRRLGPEIGAISANTAGPLSNLPTDRPLPLNTEASLGAIRTQAVGVNELLSNLGQAWKCVIPNLSLVLGAVPALVEANPAYLMGALNLIWEHSRDVMKPGTSLTVESSRAHLAESSAWARVRFTYESCGENAATLNRAFEPSWSIQLEGLPVAYTLIKDMGGQVTARFEGGMAVFEVYLRPASCSPGKSKVCRPAILLIEPRARIGFALQRHFDEHGLDLVCVSDGTEARVALERCESRFLLVMANAPEPRANRLGFQRLLPDVPVLWLTGYREDCSAGELDRTPWRCLTKWDVLDWARRAIAAGEAAFDSPEIQRPDRYDV